MTVFAKYRFVSSRFLSAGIFLLLFTAVISTLNAQVSTQIDTTLIRIGEEIQYSIEVEADSTDLVLFPEGQSFLPLEVIESYKVDTSYAAEKVRLIKKYGLTQFDSGAYMIPAQRVYINDLALATDSIFVEVQDVPVDTLEQEMFDIKPASQVSGLPFNWLNLLWLLPVLIAAGVWWYLRRKKAGEEASEPELPPYEEALFSLKRLDERQLLKENRSKEYYSRLTEIVKRYLDREVDDRAMESTSSELIDRLRLHRDAGHLEFDTGTIIKLEDILKRADLVKFARMRQLEGQASTDRHVIEQVITETHDAIPEPTEEELQQTAAYREELRKKKLRKQRIYGLSAGLGLIIIAIGIYGLIKGPEEVTEIVVSNPTKDLTMGRWVKSEYGSPAIILETPEVLVRQTMTSTEDDTGTKPNLDVFTAGDPRTFYVMVRTTKLAQTEEGVLEAAMEQALLDLEANGASNMVVKRGQYETDQGVKGLKSYGEFTYTDTKGKEFKEPIKYEVLLFAQAGALQQLTMAYLGNDEYTEGIKQRIERSVELEITEGGQP
ncbi:hypothetical protein [Aureitalea marina]|uniref:DUF4381 domain-containing protein n=1 Tax=Aureitalea marina TaxID=930804 RepID=A0A2S7KRZ6_9FLAO|nr:hypothetical protein [Aureitalea marina]PQB05333.1 hypothetical protein BST85_10885 [Aureitalea marina]